MSLKRGIQGKILPIIWALALVAALAAAAFFATAPDPTGAFAADGNEYGYEGNEVYSFGIDSGSYVFGSTANISSGAQAPVIKLQFTGSANAYSNMSFWYLLSDDDSVDADENWVEMTAGDYDSVNGTGTIFTESFVRSYAGTSGVFESYIFFRGGLAGGETEDDYYIDLTPRILSVEGISVTGNDEYNITSVSAVTGGNTYNLTPAVPDAQNWTAESIILTARTNGTDNVNYFYVLSDDASAVPVPFKVYRDESGNYYGSATIGGPDSPVQAYEGVLTVYSKNKSGTYTNTYATAMRIRLDSASPAFNVSATVPSGSGTETYSEGSWTNRNVTFTLTVGEVLSGASYFYYTTQADELTALAAAGNGKYVLEVSDEGLTTVTFVAVSGSGIRYTSPNHLTRIDKAVPDLKVAAVDANNTQICSLGDTPPSGARAGYASGSVTFTLSNLTAQQSGNTAAFSYSSDGGSTFTTLSPTNGLYVLNLNNAGAEPFNGNTYRFRVSTLSGYSDEFDFTFAVLDGNFYTDMELYIPQANPKGWINEPVNVAFTLPAFLADSVVGEGGEYAIHGYITGDTSSDVLLDAVVTDSALGAGYKVYTVSIARNLNGQSYSFVVYDLAGNAVRYETDENGNMVVDPDTEENFPLRTGILYLDLDMPVYTVVRTVGNSSIQLGDDDWSAEEVRIIITPEIPISGINCYKMRGNNPSTETLQMTADGNYVFTASESGNYGFRLMSGAGNYADVWVKVNIDSAAITYIEPNEPWSAYRINPDGSLGQEIDYVHNGYGKVATDLLLKFDVNQTADGKEGHFDILYFDYSSYDSLNASLEDYVLYDASLAGFRDGFVVAMPDDGTRGVLKFAFILRSKAVNALGVNSYTVVQTVEIEYDVRPFEISVNSSYTSASVWTGGEITYDISLKDVDNTENIEIDYYQYRLDAEGYDEWIKIDPVFGDMLRFEQQFLFGGIEQSVYVPGIGNVSGMSYNGAIYFRAITIAGLASQEVSQTVKIDRSVPDALFSLNLGSGEISYDADSLRYNVYSDSYVELFPQSFSFKAPISYYYNTSTDDRAPEFTGVGTGENDWKALTSAISVPNAGTYWLYAMNSVGTSSAFVKIYVTLDTAVPQLSVQISGPSTGSGGGLEFEWTDEAVLSLNVTNLTSVNTGLYFDYKVDGSDEWVRLSSVSVPIQANGFVVRQITFRGGDADDVPADFEILGNRINTVTFRVVNLGGSEIESESVVVRIDSAEPLFDAVFETPSLGPIVDMDLWYTEAITVTLNPAAPVNGYGSDVRNPGGVEYFYRVISGTSGASDLQRMRGNSFSTDDIVGFSGNGTVVIEIRAASIANATASSVTVTLKVDKVAPTFDLLGTAQDANNDNKIVTLTSGTWINTEEVEIALGNRATNASPVKYTYYWENGGGGEENWPADGGPLRKTSMDVLHVIAVSGDGNGIRVERIFEVKIDRDPPVIYSGNIVNNYNANNIYEDPYEYYIDQVIRYEEANLKSAMYNNFPLSNGQIIATNTVDNSNNGYVHIVIEDMAGNKAELVFYMTIFPLTVNTIELSDDHRAMLDGFKEDFAAAEAGLTESRRQYFSTLISRLEDRLFMLEKMVEDYQGYLRQVNSQQSFTLVSDYDLMYTYINYFTTEDELTRYPEWLQTKILEGIYSSYYTKLSSQFNKLNSLMVEVLDIEYAVVALPATNVVERTDYQSVIRVYNSYDSLSGDQKAVFTPNLYNKLTELKRICEVLLMQDETTGISIDGEKLVGETNGAMLMVTSYAPESQYFIEAQTTLYNMLTAADSRKILTINRLYLDGVGAQYDTGNITITLPIPEEYQNYVYFAVYRLSSDGTITAINTMRRTPDGTNVTFTTNSLSTYILATTANVVVAEKPEKIYGAIGGIEIDGTLLTYITYSVVAMFVVFVVIIILVALRRRRFLKNYNRDHKKSLMRRGIHSVPKGNPPPPSNPARPEERVGHDPYLYYRKK